MSTMGFHLQLAGVALLLLCGLHGVFPRRFDWKNDLARLSQLNRQIFYVHTAFICLVLILMGLPMLLEPDVFLQPSRLGRWVAAGFTVFWALRLFVQWFGYSSQLWRGKRLETFVHLSFTLFWSYLTLLGIALCRHQWQ
jgi:hypothetical protein